MTQKLNEILDTFENANKHDVQDYAKGHLNENHLYKIPGEKSIDQRWLTSCPLLQSRAKRQVLDGARRKIAILKEKQLRMRLKSLPPIEQTNILYKDFPSRTASIIASTSNSSLNDSDSEITEDLEFSDRLHFYPTCDGVPWLKNTLAPNQMLGVTKKDKYLSMKNFQTNVIGKLGHFDRDKLIGSKMINKMLKKLETNLKRCPPTTDGSLSLKRLECFSNSFEELIANSPEFGKILKIVKAEYDNYISYLLDIHLNHGKNLQEEFQQMSKGSVSTQFSLAEAKVKIECLEGTALSLLENTERLQKEIAEEQEIIKKKNITPATPSEKSVDSIGSESPADMYQEVEDLRVAILTRLDELNGTRAHILTYFVPVSVCHNLEQCIKETEVELQKLIKQNEYYQRSSSEMEGYLKEAIVEADTSDRDVRRIWRKIYSRKHLRDIEDSSNKTSKTPESDEDDDHESKWNWYIS